MGSSEAGDDWAAANVFDGDDATAWVADSASGWIVIDAGSDGVTSFTFHRQDAKRMRDVRILSSSATSCCDDAHTFDEVETFTADESNADIVRPIVSAARFWRIEILNTYGAGGKFAGFGG